MNKNVFKIIGLIIVLIILIAAILYTMIKGIGIGPIKAISILDISKMSDEIALAKVDLEKSEYQYENNMENLELAKKAFNTQKEAYELITDEKIAAVKEATKEEEYFIEYLWITLGNYATAHDLDLAIIEPGGTISQTNTTTSNQNDDTYVSTGTGISGNSSGVNSTVNAATTGSPTSGMNQGNQTTNQDTSIVNSLTSSGDALTVQVKGSYMDLADFVFEVENDKSLRFRLDNIKMRSSGGTEVITSFNVKDFTVLKSLD